ncbi:inactive transglutaminase family protein [Salinisphaera aquimarina]|uniref:Inactive transglutaminase family protein n=1 Tax=Salinisphaera aquimarina TaxID=2094031 RepID=A0ABV7EW56_9GAMM
MKDLHLKVLALVLVAFALGICYYKVSRLGVPLAPDASTEVWTVEATLRFDGADRSAKIALEIPNEPAGFTLLDESFISSGFGLATGEHGANRNARWAARNLHGPQTLYYRVVLNEDASAHREPTEPVPEYPDIPEYTDPERASVFALLDDVRARSADTGSFTQELLRRFNDPTPDAEAKVLRDDSAKPLAQVKRLQYVLAGARIPTRIAYVLPLVEGMRHGSLDPWLEVYNGERWLAFNPRNGHAGFPRDVLVWHAGDTPLVQLEGANNASVEFSAARSARDVMGLAQQRARLLNSDILEYSLLSLPIATQNVYKVLLTVPLGALVVVVLRNFIGLRTFGTFMPVLIALAFRETELIWGCILFSVLVALGLIVRFYLERLKLLLVPRLASMLTIVILLMSGVSVISHKLGMEHGLSIALFPMVILAMTIERMSIVWDENGPKDALLSGFGSLVVAAVGFVVMTNEWMEYLAFVFPELLLLVLAFTLLAGRYTGYRLSELWRFRAAAKAIAER